jgi:hypothetical protein
LASNYIFLGDISNFNSYRPNRTDCPTRGQNSKKNEHLKNHKLSVHLTLATGQEIPIHDWTLKFDGNWVKDDVMGEFL